MTISAAQRAWLADLGHFIGGPPPIESDPAGETHATADLAPEGLVPEGSLIDPKITIKGEIEFQSTRSEITIVNQTRSMLRMVSGSLQLERELSRLEPEPPMEIAPSPPSATFSVVSGRNLSRAGNTSGQVAYELADVQPPVRFSMRWERRFLKKKAPKVFATVTANEDGYTIEGIKGRDNFMFVVKGGPQSPKQPEPGGGGGAVDPPVDPAGPRNEPPTDPSDAAASCLITITNSTSHPLTLADSGHERGDFMTLPPATVAPGASITIAAVETPNCADQGVKGHATWEVGTPLMAVWRIEWDNPEGGKNTSHATLTTQSAGLRSTDQIGQGEDNVPVSFVLSGGDAPIVEPKRPVDEPTVTPDDSNVTDDDVDDPESPGFEPPVEATQPTLRRGDGAGPDQWVEYAQQLLGLHLQIDLGESGVFGKATEAAVRTFQKRRGLAVDGIIGNQTWAALREGPPEDPGTDGLEPHSHNEAGAEARWTLESPDNCVYDRGTDSLLILYTSMGAAAIDPQAEATLRISPPGASPSVRKLRLADIHIDMSPTYYLEIKNFRADHPSVPVDAPVSKYRLDAYMPQELGGDYYSANVVDGSPNAGGKAK